MACVAPNSLKLAFMALTIYSTIGNLPNCKATATLIIIVTPVLPVFVALFVGCAVPGAAVVSSLMPTFLFLSVVDKAAGTWWIYSDYISEAVETNLWNLFCTILKSLNLQIWAKLNFT